jgi:DNA polymerase
VQRITHDFETRSTLKLQRVGGWVYSEHETTDVICLSWAEGETDEPKLWAPQWAYDIVAPWYLTTHGISIELDCPWLVVTEEGNSMPDELAKATAKGSELCQFEAHNAFFEKAIWANIMRARYGWTIPSENAFRCSAAKVSSFALPRALEDAVNALNIEAPKDMAGNRIMQKVARPRKPRKAERKELEAAGLVEHPDGYGWTDPSTDETTYLWNEDPADLFRTWEYCRQDVRAERALSKALSDLPPRGLRTWLADQRINMRGIYVDIDMAKAALKIADQAVERATHNAIEAATVRDPQTGEVLSPSPFETLGQREKVIAWVESRGVTMLDAKGETIGALLNEDLPADVRVVLQAKRTASRTSVAKYEAILRSSGSDERIRDTMMYHGASTGRWTGKLVQPHNFVRGKMKDPDTMCAAIREGDLEWLEICYGPSDPMEVLSWALRGAITASRGRDLLAADYSSVEARGTVWLVNDQENLEVFRRPKGMPGIYREMAADIYGVPAAQIDKDTQDGSFMRFVGKQAVLGLGYGMGWKKFIATCARYGQDVSTKLAKHAVSTYREKFFMVVHFWKDIEKAAIRAVENPGVNFPCGRVRLITKRRFLYCVLPSGRPIAYYKPIVVWGSTPWGEKRKKLTHMTVDSTTHKWTRTDTWGGKLTENVVQALCCDLMTDAILRLEDNPQGTIIVDDQVIITDPYDVVMSIHDELVVEADEGKGSVKDLCAIMAALEPWAEGFPLAAEGWRGKRFRK